MSHMYFSFLILRMMISSSFEGNCVCPKMGRTSICGEFDVDSDFLFGHQDRNIALLNYHECWDDTASRVYGEELDPDRMPVDTHRS